MILNIQDRQDGQFHRTSDTYVLENPKEISVDEKHKKIPTEYKHPQTSLYIYM